MVSVYVAHARVYGFGVKKKVRNPVLQAFVDALNSSPGTRERQAKALGISKRLLDLLMHATEMKRSHEIGGMVADVAAGRKHLVPAGGKKVTLVSSPLSPEQQALAWRTYAMELRERLRMLVGDLDDAFAARMRAERTGDAPDVPESVHRALVEESSHGRLDTDITASDGTSMQDLASETSYPNEKPTQGTLIRFYPTQHERLLEAARRARMSLAEYVRLAAEERLKMEAGGN